MELLQLRYFRDAAIFENFSKVANKNMVPQPSISKTINKLENELGVLLFDRIGKRISLNDNGRYFLEKIDTALKNIDDGIEYFNMPVQSNITVYIQAGSRFVSMLTADFLTSTSDIFVSSVNKISDNSSGLYDFTFMQRLPDMSMYKFETLMQDEIVLVVSKKNILSTLDNISIKDLKSHMFIGYYKSINLRDFTDEFCHDEGGFVPTYVFETHDYQSLRYMLSKNKGIALLPEKMFNLQSSDDFKIIRLNEKVHRTIVIAWDKEKSLSKQAVQFKDFAINWFDSLY